MSPKIIISSDRDGSHVFLVIPVDVEDGLAAFSLLNTVAVAVIDKASPAGDGYRSILRRYLKPANKLFVWKSPGY